MPLLPAELRQGKPFFESKKRNWTDISLSSPPMGDWQLAPSIKSSGFSTGGALIGEAVYSPEDRNLTSTSAPIVSGVMCVAKDTASTHLHASDIVIITNSFYDKRVHTLQKGDTHHSLRQDSRVAVVAAHQTLNTRSAGGNASVSVPLICCGQIKLRVKDVEKLVAGFNISEGKRPGDMFEIGNKHFIVLMSQTYSA